jgi:hypothetical protein
LKYNAALQMPESWDDIIAEVGRRTVHVACLPHTATLEKLVACFSDFGTVNQVRLFKHLSDNPDHRVFRGTCLIEMATEEEASAVLKTPVEYQGCPVRIQTKEDHDNATKKVRFLMLHVLCPLQGLMLEPGPPQVGPRFHGHKFS